MNSFITFNLRQLKKHVKLIIFFSVFYILGIIFGIIFSSNDFNSVFYLNALNYHVIIFDISISPFKSIISCFCTGFLLTLTVFAFSFSIYTIPLEIIIVFYRGIILGASSIIFFNLSGIIGIITFIILTLPCHVIVTAGLTISSVLNFDVCKKENKIGYVIKNCLISLLFTLIASIYLFFILVTVVRPINLIF